MTQRRDYYRVLQVHPDAHHEIIKVSYRTLMQRLKMHPDLGGDHSTATLINEAFRTLGHPDRRAAYDRFLALSGGADQATTPVEPPPSPRPAAPPPREVPQCHFCLTPYEPGLGADPDHVCRACGGSLYPVQRHEADEEQRRAVERLPRNLLLVFARQAPYDAPSRGMTLDISLAGMRFNTSNPVGMEDVLLIELDFCSAIGVVRSARQKPAGWEVGVQFLTMRVKKPRGALISTVA